MLAAGRDLGAFPLTDPLEVPLPADLPLGRVPIAGSEAQVAGLRLTAESLAGRRNRISTVVVRRVTAYDGKIVPASAEHD